MNYYNKKKPVILGITGGVGSGKSLVLDLLEQRYGAFIIQADLVARELMEPGRSSYEAVVKEFGSGILAEDGTIDRPALAAVLFADDKAREKVNAMTHPLVKEEVERRMAQSKADLIVYEAALPREAALKELCQEVWYIHVPVETRVERLMASRGYTREKCMQIMGSQLQEKEFIEESSRIIENGGSVEETEKQLQNAIESVIV